MIHAISSTENGPPDINFLSFKFLQILNLSVHSFIGQLYSNVNLTKFIIQEIVSKFIESLKSGSIALVKNSLDIVKPAKSKNNSINLRSV